MQSGVIEMEKRADYTVVGIFIVCLFACMVSFFFWLSARHTNVAYQAYQVYTNENVTGLSKQSVVRFNGVSVGYVSDIKLDKRNPQLVIITIQIEASTPITTSTFAMLNSQGITGLVYIGLQQASVTGRPLLPQPGREYAVIPVRKSLIAQITNVVPSITKNIGDVSNAVKGLLNKNNQQSVQDTLRNIQHFTFILSQSSSVLSQSISRLNSTLQNTASASEHLPQLMSQLEASLGQIALASKEIKKTAAAVTQTARSSSLFVDTLSQQSIPRLNRAMSSLTRSLNQVGQLGQQLNRDPSQLLRGRAPSELGPGEK